MPLFRLSRLLQVSVSGFYPRARGDRAVTQPARRAEGTDDALDVISAAEPARTRRRVQVAKDRSGTVEALRVLPNNAKDGNQVPPRGPVCNCATPSLPHRRKCVTRSATSAACSVCVLVRPGGWTRSGYRDPVVATKLSLKSLARSILDINDEIAELDRFIVLLASRRSPPVCLSSTAWAPRTQAQ